MFDGLPEKNTFKLFQAIHEFAIFFGKLSRFSGILYYIFLKQTI